jgi:quinol monooxygenase YgiN
VNDIQVTAHCRIKEGKLGAFKAAARACLRSVREKDKGTMQYDWFFNAGRTECVVRETYKDSDAILSHVANLDDALGTLLSTCELFLEIYGSPSPALLKALEGLPHEVYGYFQGL